MQEQNKSKGPQAGRTRRRQNGRTAGRLISMCRMDIMKAKTAYGGALMTPEEMEQRDIIEFSDDEGHTLLLEVKDYFFYNGEEYAALHEAEGEQSEDAPLYVMKVNSFTDENGEEMEEFVLPEEPLMEVLVSIARTRFTEPEE